MRQRRALSMVAAGLTAAVVSGVVAALVTRPLMRVVEVLTNGTPSFDVVSSSFIAIFYVVVLAPGCVALAVSRRRWPWLLFGAGAALLLFEAVAIGVEETRDTSGMTPLRWIALVGVLALMASTYAAQLLFAGRWARRAANGSRGLWIDSAPRSGHAHSRP